MPMHQREAMWMEFTCKSDIAVKIGLGKINAVTGEPWSPSLSQVSQDWITCPRQQWLDGIHVGSSFS